MCVYIYIYTNLSLSPSLPLCLSVIPHLVVGPKAALEKSPIAWRAAFPFFCVHRLCIYIVRSFIHTYIYKCI